MPEKLPDYSASVQAAVADYWAVRRSQADESQSRGVLNTGIRAEVTGGRHLDALHELVVSVFVDAGISARLIDVKRRPIAGYFRRDKSWDIVVMVADRVVGIVELKSMAGSSPGQNYNNRTDEALGQAVDVWKAVEREIIRPQRPWLGYFMLLEDNAAFTAPVSSRQVVWSPDPAFNEASYADRYVIFFERMVRERLLDAACVVLADKDSAAVRFPSESVSFQAFAAAIHGRCLQFMATNPSIDWSAGE
ncbi:MAG: restriction endonuclease [Acidimicrobiaceae bacterium]|nr:restriction endonuclease [Acidimicrobiaceae bacterium]MCY4279911.1 restriction endonuclease [Acidimicrobiaceae bacterium]MCY4294711.1 restriction endonuclease [Acidimicrobiaceae bacterium]